MDYICYAPAGHLRKESIIFVGNEQDYSKEVELARSKSFTKMHDDVPNN
jgi:hypothetical protein